MLGEQGMLDGAVSNREDPRGGETGRSPLRCPNEIDRLDYGEPWGGGPLSENRGPNNRRDPARSYIQTQYRTDENDEVEFYSHLSYGINGGNGLGNWGGRGLPHSRWGYENKMLLNYSDFRVAPSEVISVFDGYHSHISHADFVSARHNNQTVTNLLASDGSVHSKDTEDVPWVHEKQKNWDYRPQNYYKP
jgi:hypothetical protein